MSRCALSCPSATSSSAWSPPLSARRSFCTSYGRCGGPDRDASRARKPRRGAGQPPGALRRDAHHRTRRGGRPRRTERSGKDDANARRSRPHPGARPLLAGRTPARRPGEDGRVPAPGAGDRLADECRAGGGAGSPAAPAPRRAAGRGGCRSGRARARRDGSHRGTRPGGDTALGRRAGARAPRPLPRAGRAASSRRRTGQRARPRAPDFDDGAVPRPRRPGTGHSRVAPRPRSRLPLVRPDRAPECRAPRRRRPARNGPRPRQPPRGVRDRGAARRHRRRAGSACAGPRLVKPGPDLLAAFGLALGAHAALGLVLAAPDGRAGAEGAQARAVAALAPAEATALMAAWSTPPPVGMAASAPPRPATSGESSPSRPAAASDGPPRHTAAALPVPAPPAAPPAPASRLPLPVALADSTPPPAPAPADARPVAHAAPRPQAALRPSETTARPRPRPEHQAASADVTPTPAGAKQTARDARAASPARGTGGQGTETAETRRLKAAWAGAIGARIARAQRHPGAGHGSGRVRVTLVVARDGRLAEVRVAASSGSEGLDLAAIAAVRRAAPFPQAPGALPDEWVRFGQWVAFR